MLLVIDFDGTITDVDCLDLIARRFAPGRWEEAERALVAGEKTLNEVIAFEFETVTASQTELVEFLLAEASLRPGIPELVDLCHERFIEPLVISSGFRGLIEPVLAANGIALPVRAHEAVFTPDGTVISFLERPTCPECGEPCKRGDVLELAQGRQVAYVGDGWSDRCAAKIADLRFARAGLARHLAKHGIAYEPFEDFNDVAEGIRRFLAL